METHFPKLLLKSRILNRNTSSDRRNRKRRSTRCVFKQSSLENTYRFCRGSEDSFRSEITKDGWILSNDNYHNLRNELGGWVQSKNARTVLAAIQELIKIGFKIPHDAVYKGFANVVELTGLMGRWQTLQHNPKIICDTGHNSHAIRYIVRQLHDERYKTLHIVFGMVNDKDTSTILSMLPKNAFYYFTQPSIDRALDVETLFEKAKGVWIAWLYLSK